MVTSKELTRIFKENAAKMLRIIIPAYNEEKNIESCIKDLVRILGGNKYMLYVINDGSIDKTVNIVKGLSRKNSIKLINHETNKGVSEVFKTGISAVLKDGKEGDVILIVEGDGTSDPAIILDMVSRIRKGKDVVVASRYVPGGGYKNFPVKRLFFSKAANLIFRLLYPSKKVKDYTIFFRAYSFGVLQKLGEVFGDKYITKKHFTANAEILVKILKITSKVEEVPFMYDYGNKKGASSLNISKNLVQYAKLLLDRSR